MIQFKKIRWKNFLSTGAHFIEILLDKSPTTLIVGENGAGKSTILDALCFVLFGKPFRNINKPQLINSINNKQSIVEIEFSIGTKNYLIRRGIKPNVFEIYLNDELLNQDAAVRDYQKYLETQILKLNFKSFTQIVILGSASFTPFMQLPQGHRREIIEDILDIQIFSVMNSIIKEKLNEIKDELKNVDIRIELDKQKAEVQKQYVLQLEESRKKQEEDINLRIQNTLQEIETLGTAIKNKQTMISDLEKSIIDESEQEKKQSKAMSLLAKMQDKITSANKHIEFYNHHDVCPTCSQDLDATHKAGAIEYQTFKIDEIKNAITALNTDISSYENRIAEILKIKKAISEISSQVIKDNNEIIGAQTYIRKLQEEKTNTNITTDSIEKEKIKLKNIAKDIVSTIKTKSSKTEEKYYHEIAASMLKDTGIKTKIIKQYLPVINKMVNKYLAAMDFFCHFELDDSFNETIKARHRDIFSYASFSEGEKQRIDLALLFTWRTIAKMKNSVSTNLLLLDEVFDSSLDSSGTDYVMQLLNTVGKETNIFVISHKGDQLFDKFRSAIKFEKHQNFSRIVK